MGGYNLNLVVEYYDGKRWIVLRSELDAPFDREEGYYRLLEETRAYYLEHDLGEDQDEIENEVAAEINSEHSIAVQFDDPLLDFLFDMGRQGNRYQSLSPARGPALNTQIPLEFWSWISITHFTLAELKSVDWRTRIDRVGIFSFDDYKRAFDLLNYNDRNGPYKIIDHKIWVGADKAAKRALLQYNLDIKVDHSVYLPDPEYMERLIETVERDTAYLNLDSNLIRLTFIHSD